MAYNQWWGFMLRGTTCKKYVTEKKKSNPFISFKRMQTPNIKLQTWHGISSDLQCLIGKSQSTYLNANRCVTERALVYLTGPAGREIMTIQSGWWCSTSVFWSGWKNIKNASCTYIFNWFGLNKSCHFGAKLWLIH